jgi:hypothetical protein
MPLFVIERNFADQLNLDAQGVDDTNAYNDDHELRWLFSFLSTDKRKTYCLYEAPDADALRRAAADLGIPADEIIEVSEIGPTMFTSRESATGHLA